MIVITGGAGFIGSALVWRLNQMGFTNLVLVDNLGTNLQWKNISKSNYYLNIHKDEFRDWLQTHGDEEGIEAIFHMGACSSTAEHDMNYLLKNNVHYSIDLFKYCESRQIPFIYASSAATYGMGEQGYSDDPEDVAHLRPINPYGLSKQMFDLWVLKQKKFPPFWAGLKFFNVYGPNEYHKEGMRSLVCKAVPQIQEHGSLKLFKSAKEGVADGEQQRDFIYVKDAVDVMVHFWTSFQKTAELKPKPGIYNVGTGQARSFADLGRAVFRALGQKESIDWIDMPASIRHGYQYFTEASLTKLRTVGLYKKPFTSIEDGVYDYVTQYLTGDDPYL